MKFHQLELKNFMPFYGDDHEILFPKDSDQNILLIHGANTYGKTTILRAIRWVLYGKIFDKYSRQYSFLDIINKTSKNEEDYECEVKLEFKAKNHVYEIIRNVKKKPDIDVPQHDGDFKDTIYIKKNNDVVKGADIEQEINLIAPEPVSRFFLFDGELLQEYEDLLEEGSDSAAKIKASIEQILGVPALTNGKNDTATLSKTYQDQQKKELKKTGTITQLVNSRTDAENKIKEHNKEIEKLEKQIVETNDKKEKIELSIKDIEAKSKVAEKLEKTRDRIKTLNGELAKLNQKKLEAASKAWKVLLKPKLIQIQNESLDSIKHIVNQFEKKGALKKELELINTVLTKDNCEICSAADAGNTDKPLLEKKGTSIQQEIETTSTDSNRFSKITNQNEIVNSLLNDTEERSLKDIEEELSNKIVELSQEETNKTKFISQLGGGNITAAEILQKYRKIGTYDKLLIDINDDIIDFKNKIDAINIQITNINRTIDEHPDSSDSPTTKYVSLCNNLNEIFNDSIVNLRDKLKVEVEQKASEAFIEICHRDNYKLLKINDNYGLSIIDRHNQPITIRSAGAEQIVALSLIDALSRTGVSGDRPVVMDTPFGRLDPDHRENILDYLPKSASQLMLFVHRGETDSELLNRIANKIGAEYELKLQPDGDNSFIENMH